MFEVTPHIHEDKITTYKIGGGWDDSIHWQDPDKFMQKFNSNTQFGVYGFKSNIPKVGDVLTAEFVKSFIKFTFISVEKCSDPSDMFFAKVSPIEQILKGNNHV